ncbi:F-box domain-containing protein [Tolypocladium paradoxum]|uniref:F-box domain-containing protein n=1 Tax=Tolypocladium paradoxum TaxID=94208 RepID=A0A2S4KZX8_9HYPO|nr:F-box domain-containing protein [Tolypocladium paradoxum]
MESMGRAKEQPILSPDDIENLTYPNLNLNDHIVDEKLPVVAPCSANTPASTLPTANLGALDALPLELLQEILCQLDLRTLTDFRYVNRRATELVDYLPQHRAITTHARNTLRAILGIGTGRWITCKSLCQKLHTPRCERCGDFGSYLYLLTCKRVCFLCMSQDQLFLPLSPNRARRKFGLEYGDLKTLPRMRAIRGIYSPNSKRVATRCILVDHESALRAGVARHGSLTAMNEYVAGKEAQKLHAYNATVVAAQQSGSCKRRRRPAVLDPFDGHSGNPFRFVAISRVPSVSRASGKVEWGFYCVGCRKSKCRPQHWRRKFTAVSFHEHLKQCGNIRRGQHHLD